ncbi:hypothetical protein ABIB27_003475 [Arthrobacter sp. UYEF21]
MDINRPSGSFTGSSRGSLPASWRAGGSAVADGKALVAVRGLLDLVQDGYGHGARGGVRAAIFGDEEFILAQDYLAGLAGRENC